MSANGHEDAVIVLKLLGQIDLLREGQSAALPKSKKTRALLAYLALSSRPSRRDALCAMFWDRPDDPKGALRWSLSKLRPLLATGNSLALKTDGDCVQIDTGALAIDALDIQCVLKDPAACHTDRLGALVTSGDLLEGFSLANCPNFELWLAEQRENIRRARVGALQLLLERHQSDPEKALGFARLLAEISPRDSDARLGLIDLLYRTGRHQEAERQGEMARDLLAGNVQQAAFDARVSRAKAGAPAAPVSLGEPSAASVGETAPAAERPEDGPDLPNKPSIAVLPFQTLGEGPDEVFATGLTHDIIMRISRLRWLFVIARGSAFNIQSQTTDVRDIARRLGVRYITQGSVAAAGSKLRVDVSLIDALSRNEIWVEQYVRELDDIHTVQHDISDAIAGCLQIEIEEAEQRRALDTPISGLNAWSAYHRGVWHMHQFKAEDFDIAERFFNRAIELEPHGPRPYAGLSFVQFQRAFQHLNSDYDGTLMQSLELAQKSVAAEPREALGHWALGRTLLMYREYEQSKEELEAAIEFNPNFAGAHFSLARTHFVSGESEAGIESADLALRLSPYDPNRFAMLSVRANCLVQLGRHDEAVDWVVRAARQPNAHHHILAIAAYCTALAGRDDLARQYIERLRAARGDYGFEDFLRAFPLKRQTHIDLVREGFGKVGLKA